MQARLQAICHNVFLFGPQDQYKSSASAVSDSYHTAPETVNTTNPRMLCRYYYVNQNRAFIILTLLVILP